jgi:hypothetical protein
METQITLNLIFNFILKLWPSVRIVIKTIASLI